MPSRVFKVAAVTAAMLAMFSRPVFGQALSAMSAIDHKDHAVAEKERVRAPNVAVATAYRALGALQDRIKAGDSNDDGKSRAAAITALQKTLKQVNDDEAFRSALAGDTGFVAKRTELLSHLTGTSLKIAKEETEVL